MENITYNKISETELEVTKPIPTPEVLTTKYERGFIEQQIISIQKSKDDFDALRDAELQECADILAKMDEFNIIVKPESTQEEVKPTQIEEKLPISEEIINGGIKQM